MSEIKSFLDSIKCLVPWSEALNMARRTVGKEPLDKEASDKWKAQMLLAEHSPVRMVQYQWVWKNIQQWVTTHLVRHHEGVEKFVHTQRSDRNSNSYDRDELPQGALNDMAMVANAQALINISRKRLCNRASLETREAWKQVRAGIKKQDPIMAHKMVPECVYRGFCPEPNSCGYSKIPSFNEVLDDYRNGYITKEIR